MQAISMAEAKEYVKKENEEFNSFYKNFKLLTPTQAKEMREKLILLDLIKLNEKHISKIIDILPKDKDELNKIVSDASFNEDETNKILETIKTFK